MALIGGDGRRGVAVDTAIAVCGHTGQLAQAARRARGRLDPCDPAQAGLRLLAEDHDPCDPGDGRRRARPLIAHLTGWPAPGRLGREGCAPMGRLGRHGEPWEEDVRAWLAAMVAVQAVEAGPESALGRALAAAAVALWEGQREGLSWLAEAVHLSRQPPPI